MHINAKLTMCNGNDYQQYFVQKHFWGWFHTLIPLKGKCQLVPRIYRISLPGYTSLLSIDHSRGKLMMSLWCKIRDCSVKEEKCWPKFSWDARKQTSKFLKVGGIPLKYSLIDRHWNANRSSTQYLESHQRRRNIFFEN